MDGLEYLCLDDEPHAGPALYRARPCWSIHVGRY